VIADDRRYRRCLSKLWLLPSSSSEGGDVDPLCPELYNMQKIALILCVSAFFAMVGTATAQIDPGSLNRVPKADTTKRQQQVPSSEPASKGSMARINLGAKVNSEYSDLFPIITPDEGLLLFVRKGAPQNTGIATRKDDEDIWYSVRQPDGSWGQAMRLEGPLNTEVYDGVRAINSTATRLYLQNVYREDGTRGKGFSVSTKSDGGGWSYPDSLQIDDYYNDTTTAAMSISSDERTIVFSLHRKDGKGQHDLFVSKNLGGNHWSRPEPIAGINTPQDEISPYIAYDDRTLYFSTNGRGGVGLHDLFVTHRLDDTWQNWTEPRNLGEPINTASFDAYFMVSGNGDTAYFSSPSESQTRGFGKSDIWKIALPKFARPGFDLPHGLASDDLKKEDVQGQLFRLDNVLFDVGKATIQKSSLEMLDQLVQLLNKFPEFDIEVQGHTDSDGDPKKNLELSDLRAIQVKKYLLSKGIADRRVEAVGYGHTRPIAPNDSKEGKRLNRRVMVLVKGSPEKEFRTTN
jgi:outer membrane protein OmpA-like peptidoglycan-associated protein